MSRVRIGIDIWSNMLGLNITPPTEVPTNLIAPVISGTPDVGEILISTIGSWNNYPSSYGYQWQRNSVDILGAINSQYTLTIDDSATTITCDVVATNSIGNSNAATSNGILIN